jgi:hypothetical protein
MWYMYKEVVLTKDNLAKRNWNSSKQCSFCLKHETIQHLFFNCYYVRFIWVLVQITFNIPPPRDVKHMFNAWVGVFKRHLVAGASLFCWAIWLSRNDVFDKFFSDSLF